MSSNNHQTVLDALAVAVGIRTPVLLWGPPGTGKTSAVRGVAEGLGLTCEVVIAAIHDPTDFSGLPVVAGGDVHLAPPRWARRLAQASARGYSSVLFLDELSTAPPAVQAALLRVVLERTVGDLELGAGVSVVAAANPPEQAADGWDLSAPLANRFCHLDWLTNATAFAHGLVSGWRTEPRTVVPEGWESRLPAARGLIGAFVSARPQLLCAVPDGAGAGRAWPSPRSWELACRLSTAAEAAGAGPEVRSALVTGAVGEGAAVELLAWQAKLDLPDPADVLANPGRHPLPKRADRLFALLSAVAAAVSAEPTVERWEAGCAIVARAAAGHPDVAAVAGRALAGCRPDNATAPKSLASLAPVLRKAGLLGAA
jgi:hypothetical protein